jgi:hypothetical protein
MNDLKNEDKINILKIYDEIYTNKIKNDDIQEQKNDEELKEGNIQIHYYNMEEILRKKIQNINHKTFTFFEFYKYYISSDDIKLYFYNIINPQIVSCKTIKNAKGGSKYIFKYKKISLDQNIILKYIYRIKQMDEKTREKCFKNVIKEKIEKKESIKSYDNFISSGLEKYFIDVKTINNMELLNFSILGILILTVSKHNLIYFSKEINEVISNLTFLTRKFVEIILSISLRLFS